MVEGSSLFPPDHLELSPIVIDLNAPNGLIVLRLRALNIDIYRL